MIVILGLVIIGLIVALVYSRIKIIEQEVYLEEYRLLVLEWYMYLNNKEHSEDFEMWRKELE